ncbi:UTRA domain-containing protein [Sinorhizobium meliloti]|uniref:UTRA domain-containing protein n=1 Tax=Rhizobium meliloti TaxID=382 RepID=UPI000FDBF4FD|nr:UTRA domain-containing protein [Sinorhizobium meliloti]RVP19066.1 UTRA domain-containing protein [Sinorhizobium meliloti]
MSKTTPHSPSDAEPLPPLAERIRQIVSERVAAGELDDKGQLPSERWLTDHFGLARMTVRKALWQLEAEGFIYRFHRSGWFLSPPRFFYDPTRDVSFTKAVTDQGRRAGAQVLSTRTIAAAPEIAYMLGITPRTPLLIINRLRFIDDRPVFVEVSHVIAYRCPGLADFLGTDVSMATIYERHYGIGLRRREIYLHPTALIDPHARDLRLAHGTPGLFLRRITDDTNGKPFSFDHEYWRHDALEIKINFFDRPTPPIPADPAEDVQT